MRGKGRREMKRRGRRNPCYSWEVILCCADEIFKIKKTRNQSFILGKNRRPENEIIFPFYLRKTTIFFFPFHAIFGFYKKRIRHFRSAITTISTCFYQTSSFPNIIPSNYRMTCKIALWTWCWISSNFCIEEIKKSYDGSKSTVVKA